MADYNNGDGDDSGDGKRLWPPMAALIGVLAVISAIAFVLEDEPPAGSSTAFGVARPSNNHATARIGEERRSPVETPYPAK